MFTFLKSNPMKMTSSGVFLITLLLFVDVNDVTYLTLKLSAWFKGFSKGNSNVSFLKISVSKLDELFPPSKYLKIISSREVFFQH